MKKTSVLLAIAVVAMISAGCSASFTTNTTTNTNAAGSNSKPANTASNSSSNATSPKKEKAKLADEKKPEGKSNKAKNNPVPESWVYVYDESKGYGFSVPEGTTGESQTVSGIDVFTASTPDGIDIFVLSYKDQTRTKDDLLDDAVKFLEGMGQTVKPGELKGESDDYYVADADTEYKSEGRKGKLRILVGTDVTDNYIMIIGTDAGKFAANEKTIDEIWGSFEMWSGGASGN